MKHEFSAGGIVYKQLTTNNPPALPAGRQPTTVWLISQHSQHKGWVFPKGLIGDTIENEKKEETAVREVQEETGIIARIVNDKPIITNYWYRWNKERIHKTVYFFLMEYQGGDFKNHDHEMMDVRWADKEEVRKTLTYKNDKNAFESALKLFHVPVA